MATKVMPLAVVRLNFLATYLRRAILRRNIPCQTFLSIHRRARSTAQSTNEEDLPDLVSEVEIQQDEIAKRDVSRLPKHLRDQMEHILSIPHNGEADFQQTLKYKRSLYAKYGKASGVPANVMWPSKAELAEIIEDEREWEPTLHERWARLNAQCLEEAEEARKREELVEAQMARMPKYIEQFRAKLHKLEESEQQVEAKRKILLDEAREYFGYNIDIRDPRFEQMKEEKEEREKEERKKTKKAEREAKMLGNLEKLRDEAAKEKAASSAVQKSTDNTDTEQVDPDKPAV